MSGVVLVHDAVRYGRDYGPNTGFVRLELLVGLVTCAFGLLLGTSSTRDGSAE